MNYGSLSANRRMV